MRVSIQVLSSGVWADLYVFCTECGTTYIWSERITDSLTEPSVTLYYLARHYLEDLYFEFDDLGHVWCPLCVMAPLDELSSEWLTEARNAGTT